METLLIVPIETPGVDLKNFLKGMETDELLELHPVPPEPSKTSLKGWKHGAGFLERFDGQPSKTSLKGWKRGQGVLERDGSSDLKNFLKGMETHPRRRKAPCAILLKNFLKGMET